MAEDADPLPGNCHALDGEVIRLRHVAAGLEGVAGAVHRARVDGWQGDARERFDLARARLREHHLRAAEAFATAAGAVEDYRAGLVELQPRARYAVEEGRAAGPVGVAVAREQVERWRRQLDLAGDRAAAAVDEARRQLAELRRVFGEPPAPVPVAAPATRAVAAPAPSPRPDLRDQSTYERELRRLNDALLTSFLALR
ncbi:hypothetical protein JOF41_006434 [Saccharothrix coeruleofusca]|uniref:putative T7SS-secreted protein n=1 Tax=Saccharothrix coeruleofusca TaxID=33919 RepID=UPI001AE72804|nr:hypothetical protein [Saccharothrix coeruleofusca]MBP2340256.1 hypothetical protein [Saccharothrix coeruleofusca]